MADWNGFEHFQAHFKYILSQIKFVKTKRFKFKIQNSCEGIKSGLVPAQPLSDLASPIDDPGCSINSEECCTAGP